QTERLQRLEQARQEQGQSWRLNPVVEALQALRGVPCTVAVPPAAALGAPPRFEQPRPLMGSWGLPPAASSRGARRRQGALTNAGNTHARRALVAGAWASRSPAKVSRHLQRRLAKASTPIPESSGTGQLPRGK